MIQIEDPRKRKDPEIETLYRRYSWAGTQKARLRRLLRLLLRLLVLAPLHAAKRILDFVLAALLLVLVSPLLVLGLLLSRGRLQRTPRLGRWCIPFPELSFVSGTGPGGAILRGLRIGKLPVLLNILKGDMSFVGPRPVSPGEMSAAEYARPQASQHPSGIDFALADPAAEQRGLRQ